MSFSWDLKDLFANTEDFYEQIENIKILLEQIKQYENGTFINQSKYTKDLLKMFKMDN